MNKTDKVVKEKKKSPSNTDFDLWVLLDQTRFALCRARELELAHFGLTLTHAYVFFCLQTRGGSATINDIVKFTMKQHHSVSTLIERMAKKGMVKKVKHPKNSKLEIIITPKGQQLYEKVTRTSVEMIFTTLSPEDKQRFAGYLKQVRSRARELLGMDYKPPFLPE
jgi:DNA-binding MarR family transcriptional regulator